MYYIFLEHEKKVDVCVFDEDSPTLRNMFKAKN